MKIDYLDARCVAEIRAAMSDPDFDQRAFAKWISDNGVAEKRNPSAYFMAAFPNSLRKGAFRKAGPLEIPDPNEEPVAEAPPKPPDRQDEADAEERDYREHVELLAVLSKLHGQPCGWHEPNDPRFDKSPSIFDTVQYKGHEEYKENTFISVYREARDTDRTMHEICRERGLEYGALIM